MKFIKHAVVAFAGMLLFSGCGNGVEKSLDEAPYNQGIHIIPQPVKVNVGQEQGSWTLTSSTKIIADESLAIVTDFLKDKIANSTGYNLSVESTSSNPAKEIRFVIVTDEVIPHEEGYSLDVTSDGGVLIQASTPRGAFWGMQSLLQLFPAEIESPSNVNAKSWTVPYVSIEDYPQFSYRGQHVDPCRHFQTIDDVKKTIDVLSMLKINKLHFHLTEDQGWRIEIKKYPRLTEVGAVRTEGDGTTYGPYFYTQEEIKDLVAYADARFVEIIPEIELPGHAVSALSAYPWLGCKGEDFPYEVRNIWGISNEVICAGKDSSIEFYKDVLTEVMPLFHTDFIHIGGDEAPKTEWKRCPNCQKRIREQGLKDEDELQSWFISQIGTFLSEHGKRMIGWDEILEGGIPENATIMSWRGEQGGINAAKAGHDVIMTPSSHGFYLDYYQGDPNVEPVALCCRSTLSQVYAYVPISEHITPEMAPHILGVQGNNWSEYIPDGKHAQYMAQPRMAAIAEVAWSPVEQKDFDGFVGRLENFTARLGLHDYNYFIPQPEQPDNRSIDCVTFTGESVTIPFGTVYPVHKIIYTTDGTDPVEGSAQEYSEPLTFSSDTELRIRSLTQSGAMSPVRIITIRRQDYAPAVAATADGYDSGLDLTTVRKQFKSSDDFESYSGDGAVVLHGVKLSESGENVYKEQMEEHLMSNVNWNAQDYSGYVMIPEDGVYRIRCSSNRLWLDGHMIIDNTGVCKRNTHSDVTLALAQGLHKIRFTQVLDFIGNWPSGFYDQRPYMGRFDKGEPLKAVPDEAYFCDKK